jgi:oligopeptide/dipeptide ABC transporter ATP-binding protein
VTVLLLFPALIALALLAMDRAGAADARVRREVATLRALGWSVAEVLRAPRHPYTKGLLDSLPANATPGQDLVQIPGSTPSLLNLPPGCPFAPRCSYADDLCRTEPPRLTSGSRAVRCHHPLAREAA